MRLMILAFTLMLSALFADPPKAIIFDYGNVVAKVEREQVFRFLADSLLVPYTKLRNDFGKDKFYEALNEPVLFWEKYADKKLSVAWEEALAEKKKTILTKIQGMEELILGLKAQGIQTILLSNTSEKRARFIEAQGGYDLFDPILLSCHLGTEKPNGAIYQKLLSMISFTRDECLFIDNEKENVASAKACGIDGVVFKSVILLKHELAKRGVFVTKK